jgi:hypothetical protein
VANSFPELELLSRVRVCVDAGGRAHVIGSTVFELLMQRNGKKRDKKKWKEKNDRYPPPPPPSLPPPSTFLAIVFDMDFPPKAFCGVFELPLVEC